MSLLFCDISKMRLTDVKNAVKLAIKDGWISCPGCGRHLLRVLPDTEADRLPVYCRGCRTEILLQIDRGLSARRLSP